MDKPQSWTFLLSIMPILISKEDKRAKRVNQDSPLRLATREDAISFGKRMFEPPLSIIRWDIVGSQEAPNFPFKKQNE
jgi:hypothetical protein